MAVGGGAVGSFAGASFEPVFFVAGGRLRRVEWSTSAHTLPDLGAGLYAQLLAWGRGRFGAELGSHDPGSSYAAWTEGDMDIYLQRTEDPRHAVVRLVYKLRQVQDASEL